MKKGFNDKLVDSMEFTQTPVTNNNTNRSVYIYICQIFLFPSTITTVRTVSISFSPYRIHIYIMMALGLFKAGTNVQ